MISDKVKIVERIKSQTKCFTAPDMTPEMIEISALAENILLIKGTFLFSLGGNDGSPKYQYPYFGILLEDKNILISQEFHELEHAFWAGESWYFVTYWQKAEAGSKGVIIYRLEGVSLVDVFRHDYGT